ncbi:alpha/beta hydrolase [Butyrivibrio sp. JL13D10]|uniref:alpha/beta hydrolase n=1 Tax=Butyrivibrio sp. JL13D10 TaxID=3236815 RepID=UPI0038B46C7C
MKKKKITKVLSIIAIIVVVLVIGLSVGMGAMITDQVLYQNKNNDTVGNSIKQLAEWGYDLDGFNSKYASIGKEISAAAEDGNEVPATYFDNGGDVCVILVHGAGGDRVFSYPLAEQYLDRGYDVIALDQRGCGSNPDKKVTFGINESLDVKALVKYSRETLGKEKVVVHGQSMGGQTTAIYASNVTPGEIDAADAVICDSPVPGMEYMLRSIFGDDDPKEMYGPVSDYLMFTCGAYMKIANGIDYKDGDTIAQVAKDELPTMIIVSDKDKTCLPEKVMEVYDNVASPDKTEVHIDCEHIKGVFDDPDHYMTEVTQFLGQFDLR